MGRGLAGAPGQPPSAPDAVHAGEGHAGAAGNGPPRALAREFFNRPADQVAPELLGCVLAHETADGIVAVRLSEVEAYAGQGQDPASHSYHGRTARNSVMFGPPGHAYVYFTYGMHFCVNLVCMPAGTSSAVLLRAGEIIEGHDLARARRSPSPAGDTKASTAKASTASDRELARGPARLCQALAITRVLDGADACDPASGLRIQQSRAVAAPATIRSGPRVGIKSGADTPWRFWIASDPTVSAYRPHAPRHR